MSLSLPLSRCACVPSRTNQVSPRVCRTLNAIELCREIGQAFSAIPGGYRRAWLVVDSIPFRLETISRRRGPLFEKLPQEYSTTAEGHMDRGTQRHGYHSNQWSCTALRL